VTRQVAARPVAGARFRPACGSPFASGSRLERHNVGLASNAVVAHHSAVQLRSQQVIGACAVLVLAASAIPALCLLGPAFAAAAAPCHSHHSNLPAPVHTCCAAAPATVASVATWTAPLPLAAAQRTSVEQTAPVHQASASCSEADGSPPRSPVLRI